MHKVTSGIIWHQFGSTIIYLIIIKVICSNMSICRSSSTIILCNIIHAIIMSLSISRWKKRVGPRTITNRAWSTPNAHSTSFLAASCAEAKCCLLQSCGVGIVLKNVAHDGYIVITIYRVINQRNTPFGNMTFRFEFIVGFKVKKIWPLGLNLLLSLNFKILTIRFEFTIGFKVKKYDI